MKKYSPLILLALATLMINRPSKANDLAEGLEAGRDAYKAMQGGNFGEVLNQTVNTEAMQSILNQSMDKELADCPSDPSIFPNKTAQQLIRQSVNTGGKSVNSGLLQQSIDLEQQQFGILQTGILASGLKPDEASKKTLTPNQIVNQNLLTMETFPNVRCPATESAFKMAETEDLKEAAEFGESKLNVSLQEHYSTETKTDEIRQVYEMGCTTTLLNAELIADETLHIETVQSEPPGTKTITAIFTANAYNQSSFSLNFKKGTLSSGQGGIQTNYFSDTLGEAFSKNTIVSCLESSGTGEGGVRFSLDYNPCFLNGFLAAYDAFQPKTGSKYTENRWRVRGGRLVYKFSDIRPRIPAIVSEKWRRTNTELEDLVVLGECKKIRTECIDVKPKKFGSHPPFLTLKRPCWKRKIFYRCNIPQGDNDCDKIPKNCSKIGSEFIDFLGQHAVEVHQFRCQRIVIENKTHKKSIGYQSTSNGDYQKNNDIGDAIAGLNIAKEITTGFRGEARGFKAAFFAGEALACTSKPKQCCADSKSFWRKLTGCRESEQRLAMGIAKGVCHEVGTYRVKNSLLQKIGHVDKKGYCCFPSKLSRIIQEGARSQLQLSWGAPESPNCRALTISEIQRIDWSGIDFREVAKDVMEKAKNTPVSPALQQMIQNQLSNSLTKETTHLKTNYPNTPHAKEQALKNKDLEEKIKAADSKRRLKGTQTAQKEKP
jgi:hypothetical protein